MANRSSIHYDAKEMAELVPSLIFVYNGDSGLLNTVLDISHKLFSPSTYPCKLCALTHGLIRMESRWREFIESYEGSLEFLHRDQYVSSMGVMEVTLPVILERRSDSQSKVLVGSDEIAAVATAEELIQLIKSRLALGEGDSTRWSAKCPN